MEKTKLSQGYTLYTNKDNKTASNVENVKIKDAYDIVSVIMTFYNAEAFIEQAMRSVILQQTHGEGKEHIAIEFVIVDDKSQDNSRKIVEAIKEKFEKELYNSTMFDTTIKIVEPEKNLGCGGARKFGIENATGNYYMFLDADDYYINTDFILRAHELMKRNADVDIIEFGVRMNIANGQVTNSVVPQPFIINDHNAAEVALFKDNVIKFNVWSKIYKESVIKSHEYSDSRTFEDVRTVPYWVQNAKQIMVMNTVEVNYRANQSSIIRNNVVETRIGTITAIASLFGTLTDNIQVLKAMYERAMIDITALCDNHSEENEGFKEMSALNTFMLKHIYVNDWYKLTFNPDVPEFFEVQKKWIDEQSALQSKQ